MKSYLKNISIQLELNNSSIRLGKVNRVSSIIPRTYLKVGALFAFMYLGRYYTAYVIATNKTETGLYISNRRNLLVTCLVVDLTQVSSQITLSRIYKRRKASDYKVLQGKSYQLEDAVSDYFKKKAKDNKEEINFSLFGKENFKTFKVKNIQSIINLKLDFIEED
jgi:hypothetical protein